MDFFGGNQLTMSKANESISQVWGFYDGGNDCVKIFNASNGQYMTYSYPAHPGAVVWLQALTNPQK